MPIIDPTNAMVVDRRPPPPLLNATRRPRDCEIETGQKPYSLEAEESRENKEDERRRFSAAMRADQSSFSDLILAGITLIRIVNDPEVPPRGGHTGEQGEGRGEGRGGNERTRNKRGEIEEDRSVNRLARKVAPSSRSRVRTTPSRRLEPGLYVQAELFKRLYK